MTASWKKIPAFKYQLIFVKNVELGKNYMQVKFAIKLC